MKTVIVLTLIVVLAGASSFAQDALPPGKWWRQQRVVQHLELTTEQQQRLDGIFQQTAGELIDLRANVEKRSLALRYEMDQAQVNRQAVQRAATSLTDARARLF